MLLLFVLFLHNNSNNKDMFCIITYTKYNKNIFPDLKKTTQKNNNNTFFLLILITIFQVALVIHVILACQ